MMTWLDLGIGVCSCGIERRLYKPDNADCALCQHCAKRYANRQPTGAIHNGLSSGSVYDYVVGRRRRLEAAGLCIDCARRAPRWPTKRCAECGSKQVARLRRRRAA